MVEDKLGWGICEILSNPGQGSHSVKGFAWDDHPSPNSRSPAVPLDWESNLFDQTVGIPNKIVIRGIYTHS